MYRVVQKVRTSLLLALTLSNLNRFARIFLLRERGRKFQRESQNIFRHTLNMLLQYLVKLLICSNMMQIWKKMKTKCIDFECTEYSLSSLVTYCICWCTYYLIFWFVLNILWHSRYFIKIGLNVDSCPLYTEHASLYNFLIRQHPFYSTKSNFWEVSLVHCSLLGCHPAASLSATVI